MISYIGSYGELCYRDWGARRLVIESEADDDRL
jgi:hypothetical protein